MQTGSIHIAQQRIEEPDAQSAYAVLRNVAQRTNLAEGSEGVRRIVRAIAQGGSTPLHELCRLVSMPVPVVAAVRRELEKLGLVCRRGGVTLSSSGYHLAHDGLLPRRLLLHSGCYFFLLFLFSLGDLFSRSGCDFLIRCDFSTYCFDRIYYATPQRATPLPRVRNL